MSSDFSILLKKLEDPLLLESTVIGWSSPILAFGDISISKIATVGLNPSNREFMDVNGRELEGEARRFHTLKSLNLKRWIDAQLCHHALIVDQCKEYFIRNPYDLWFKRLDYLISGTDVSYYFPSLEACHLDLIPYATEKKWTDLTLRQRQNLLEQSRESVGMLLKNSKIKVLILNGQTVVDVFERLTNNQLERRVMIDWSLPRKSGKNVTGYSYLGEARSIGDIKLPASIKVLGYNHNIQSSFGVTKEVLTNIRKWISKKANDAL